MDGLSMEVPFKRMSSWSQGSGNRLSTLSSVPSMGSEESPNRSARRPWGRTNSSSSEVSEDYDIVLDSLTPAAWMQAEGFVRQVSDMADKVLTKTKVYLRPEPQYVITHEEACRLRQERWVLLPSSSNLCRWDIFVFALIVGSGIYEPYVWVFNIDTAWANAIAIILSLIFSCDTFMHFIRAKRQSTREGVVLVTHLPTLAKRYLRGMFVVDFFSSVPWSLFLGPEYQICCLIRLLRFTHAGRLMMNLQAVTGLAYSSLNMVEFAVISCLVLHWIACFWGYVGLMDQHHSWLAKAHEDVHVLDLSQMHNVYLLSLYWSVTVLSSVGFGDVTPTTRVEFLCAIMCMAIGGCVWAYIVGSVCSMATSFDKHRNEFENQMNDVTVLARERRLPYQLQERVRDFYKHAREFMRMKQYHATIRELSPGLKGEVVGWMYGRCFQRVWYFDIVDDRSATILAEGMFPQMYAPSEWVEASIETQRALVFLRSGLCVRKNNLLAPGAAWGLDVILATGEIEDIEELLDTALARSINFAFVLKLGKNSIDHTASLIPEFAQRLRKAHLRMLLWRGIIATSRKRMKDKKKKGAAEEKQSKWDMLGKLMGQVVHRERVMLDESHDPLQCRKGDGLNSMQGTMSLRRNQSMPALIHEGRAPPARCSSHGSNGSDRLARAEMVAHPHLHHEERHATFAPSPPPSPEPPRRLPGASPVLGAKLCDRSVAFPSDTASAPSTPGGGSQRIPPALEERLDELQGTVDDMQAELQSQMAGMREDIFKFGEILKALQGQQHERY